MPRPWWKHLDPATGPTAPRRPGPGDAAVFVVGYTVRLLARPERVRRVVAVEWHAMRHCFVYVLETSGPGGRYAYWFAEQLCRADRGST